MLISSSSSTSDDSRLRRKAAEENARSERVAKDAAVREGQVRQAGEAPQAEEVDRFRALMQNRGEPRTTSRTQTPTGQETQAPKRQGEPMQAAPIRLPADAQGVAERFRAAMLAAFDSSAAVPSAPPQDEGDAKPQQNTHAAESGDPRQARNQDAAPRQADAGQRAQPQPEATPRREIPRDGALLQNKALPADASKQDARADASRDAKNETQSPQQIAQKLGRGDTEATQAVRAAHADKDLDDKNGHDASTASMAGNGMTPSMPPAEAVAQPMPQAQMQPDAPQQAAQTASFAPALSELLQKHVRQMLVTDPRSARGRPREVLLRMQNDALPGTDLWLTRTDSGWSLRAEVSSRDAYDTLLEFQDELVKRFADSRLGELSIEPVFHGPVELGGSDRGRNAMLRGS